jgi:hypothetical protein
LRTDTLNEALAFGLLGLASLDTFFVSIDAYEEWVEFHLLNR